MASFISKDGVLFQRCGTAPSPCKDFWQIIITPNEVQRYELIDFTQSPQPALNVLASSGLQECACLGVVDHRWDLQGSAAARFHTNNPSLSDFLLTIFTSFL